MKKLIISLAIIFTFVAPIQRAHAIEAKQKAFLVMAGYGTVGGALLGFASMAFGTNSRAIAQGASLGLYAGIIFGAYVISSHHSKMNQPILDPYAPPVNDPYAPPANDPYAMPPSGASGYGAPPPSDDQGGFFGNRAEQINMDMSQNFKSKVRGNNGFSNFPIYLNLYNSTF